jgi:hypothetical protein
MIRHVAFVCLLGLITPLLAQQSRRGDWSQVASLTTNQGIELHPFRGSRLRGRFLAATPQTISLDLQSGQRTFNRTDVRLIKVRRGSARIRNAGFGALIGGGIAGGVSAAALHRDFDDGLGAAITVLLTMIGAGVGFAVGLIPAAYGTLYEAQRP